MLLDAIATVILAGLMLIPLVNVVVGGVVGAGLAGPLGGITGILLAIAIAALETWLADRLVWRDLRHHTANALNPVADEMVPATERSIRAGTPTRRRQSHRVQEAKAARRRAPPSKLQHGTAR
jgi:hypothetical protein